MRGTERPDSPPAARRRACRALAAAVSLAAAPLLALGTAQPARALGNGLALTPQMGFNDWNAYGCNVSESLIKSTALAMHNNGMQAAGYQYVNIDDCWMHPQPGRLRATWCPDPAKFPDGISGTAAYVHSLGLKLGIYEDAGTTTCAGYPGQPGAREHRRELVRLLGRGLPEVRQLQRRRVTRPATADPAPRAATPRCATRWPPPAARSCSACATGARRTCGPGARASATAGAPPATSTPASAACSRSSTATWAWPPTPGPAAWNDPDMLEIGNGMSATEDRSEFSLWSEMAAPLISGTNIANASSTTLSILTNKRGHRGRPGLARQAGHRGLLLRRPGRAGQAAGQRRRVGRAVQREQLHRHHLHHGRRDRQDRREQLHPDRPVERRDLHHQRHHQRLRPRARHRHVPRRRRHHRRRRRVDDRRGARGRRGQVPGRARTARPPAARSWTSTPAPAPRTRPGRTPRPTS